MDADTCTYLHACVSRVSRVECAGASARVVAELQFEIPKMYKHHKHESLDVAVDFWRFSPRVGEDAADGVVRVPSSNLSGKGAEGKGGGGRGGGKGGGGKGGGGKGGGGKGGKGSGGAAGGLKSKQEARANAKARVEHYGGGGKKETTNRRGDGYRVTKLG